MSLNVTFKRASIEAAAEFGSLKELAGYIGEESALLTTLFGEDMEIVVKGLTETTAIASGTVETTTEQAGGKRRGRPAKNTPDPATAAAPPPAPIPGATPAAPVDTTPNANGIPAFLDRTAAPPAPPPPAPPAPPAPPVVPPSGILAGKCIADLDRRGTDDATKTALVGWLASPGLALVLPTASYDDAIAAIRLMGDDKLGALATALAVQ